mgnify:CR=1 FL=1
MHIYYVAPRIIYRLPNAQKYLSSTCCHYHRYRCKSWKSQISFWYIGLHFVIQKTKNNIFSLSVKQMQHKTAVTVVNRARKSFQFWANKPPPHHTNTAHNSRSGVLIHKKRTTNWEFPYNNTFLGQKCFIFLFLLAIQVFLCLGQKLSTIWLMTFKMHKTDTWGYKLSVFLTQ